MSAQLLKPKHLFIVNTNIALGLAGPFARPAQLAEPRTVSRIHAAFVQTDRDGDAITPLHREAPNFTSFGVYISP